MSQITWVPVIDAKGQPLAPCSTDKARQLLKQGKARPCRRWDIFAIQLRSKNVPTEEIGQSTIAVNPGAEYTGLAGFRQKPATRRTPLLALVLHHRGQTIRKRMEQRAKRRHARRYRLRYRKCRYKNRKKRQGWLAPSVKSRLDNTLTWISRLQRLVAIDQALVEALVFERLV